MERVRAEKFCSIFEIAKQKQLCTSIRFKEPDFIINASLGLQYINAVIFLFQSYVVIPALGIFFLSLYDITTSFSLSNPQPPFGILSSHAGLKNENTFPFR